jgi:hypothetical protein
LAHINVAKNIVSVAEDARTMNSWDDPLHITSPARRLSMGDIVRDATIMERMKFDAETVIADFLGDLWDGNERVGKLDSAEYKRLRKLAQVLIADLKDNGLAISSLQKTGDANERHG